MSNQILVGYARVDITPEEYTNLAGNGLDAKRICNKVWDRIYGSCIAITDARGETILYCPVDLLHTTNPAGNALRTAISEATGVPVSRVMTAASHSHSGPSLRLGLEKCALWFAYLKRQMVKCALEAMADRKEAEIFAGQRQVPHMTFVRHYHMNDGTVAGPNSGSFASGAKAHITDPDEQLQVIRFVRKAARDVVLVNWQCHATISGGMEGYSLSGDYIGHLRNHLEGLTGTHFAFFQGAAGNLVPTGRLEGENLKFLNSDGEEVSLGKDASRYGRAMAEHVVSCLNENMQPVSGGAVRATAYTFVGKIDHSDDHLAQKAEAALSEYHKWPYEQRFEALKQTLRPAGFNSHLHAGGIINRSKLGDTRTMELWALSVGEIGFICAPYEMFCSSGMYIKKHSPFAMTFVVSCSNDYNAYMADDTAFNYDIYEVNTRRYGRGTAERLAEIYVQMLKDLRKEK